MTTSPAPDLIVCAGRVFGADGCDAVAISGERIEAIGSRAGMLALRGPSTLVIDRPQALITPGIHDAHVHLGHLGAARTEIDLHGLDLAGVRDAVAAVAATRDPLRWIVGRGFDPEIFRGSGVTAVSLLDAAAPDHAVLLRSHDYHAVALNTRALHVTGFLPSKLHIEGGVEDRDAAGAFTGILREQSAVHASVQCNDVTREELATAVLRGIAEMHRAGITTVTDMSGTRHHEILRMLDDGNCLPLDVFATLSPADVADLELRREGSRLRIVGMKTFLDGALGSRTAHLLEPYEGETCHCGVAVLPADEVDAAVRGAAEAGLPSYLHAIGNAAVRTALDALARHPHDGTARSGDRRLRHRVEHAQMIHDADLPRFAALGIAASMQPVHIATDASVAHRHWGKRSREAFPVRRLLDSGARVAFGSDTPIETFDVLEGIARATSRRGRDGTLLSAGEAVTVEEALVAYTSTAAWCAGAEREHGVLRRGAVASLTLFSRDIARSPEALADTTIDATIVRGSVVHAGDGVL